MGGGADEVVQREDAAAVQLNEARLQALGAPVLQVGLDRPNVAFVVLHVAVCGLRAVRHGSHAPDAWAQHDIACGGPSTEPRVQAGDGPWEGAISEAHCAIARRAVWPDAG